MVGIYVVRLNRTRCARSRGYIFTKYRLSFGMGKLMCAHLSVVYESRLDPCFVNIFVVFDTMSRLPTQTALKLLLQRIASIDIDSRTHSICRLISKKCPWNGSRYFAFLLSSNRGDCIPCAMCVNPHRVEHYNATKIHILAPTEEWMRLSIWSVRRKPIVSGS